MKIKNLLIIGTFTPGSIELYFEAGLRKWGINVITYDITSPYYDKISKNPLNKVINKINPAFFYQPLNRQLMTWLDKREFDVLLVFRGMELFPETVAVLKQHACVLANFNGDHPLVFYSPGSGNKNVLDSIPFYDLHISYSKSIVTKLKKRFSLDAYCVPFGYNSHVNIPPESFSRVYEGKYLFIGNYDKGRARYLEKLNYPNLDIYGGPKWKTRNRLRPNVLAAYKNKPLFDYDYAMAAVSASGIINLLRKQNLEEDSHNMRTFEVPGYRGLLLSQRTKEQMEFFEDNKEAVYFDTMDELKEKLGFLSKHPAIIHRIKKAGYERACRSNYSYDHRSQLLLNYLQYHFRH